MADHHDAGAGIYERKLSKLPTFLNTFTLFYSLSCHVLFTPRNGRIMRPRIKLRFISFCSSLDLDRVLLVSSSITISGSQPRGRGLSTPLVLTDSLKHLVPYVSGLSSPKRKATSLPSSFSLCMPTASLE